MTSDNLDTLSDAALSETFAVEVAGWKRRRWQDRKGRECSGWDSPSGDKLVTSPPTFATSFEALLPYLQRRGVRMFAGKVCYVHIFEDTPEDDSAVYAAGIVASACASTLPRAAAIALIRSKRASSST